MRWLIGFGLVVMSGCVVLQFNSQLTAHNLQLLYGSNRDGNWEIYTMDVVSKKERRLTNSKADDLWPVGSPDGGRIAFVSTRDGNQELYVMEADGSRQLRLTFSEADEEDPDWSPDGEHIVYTSLRDGNEEIYFMSFADGVERRMTHTPAMDAMPVWSPDGGQILFVSTRDGNPEIYVISLGLRFTVHGSQPPMARDFQLSRLTQHPANDGQDTHVWSPDGKQIAFVSERDGNQEIYLMAADGSGQRNLTQNPAADDAPVWSPDGQSIAFISDRDGDFEIYVVHTPPPFTRLTHATGADLWPVWSPMISGGPCGSENRPPMPPGDPDMDMGPLRFDDANPHMPHTRRGQAEPDPRPAQPLAKPEGCFGSQIAFISERDGNPEVYVMRADGTDQRRMTRTHGEEKWVSWIK